MGYNGFIKGSNSLVSEKDNKDQSGNKCFEFYVPVRRCKRMPSSVREQVNKACQDEKERGVPE